MSPFTIHNQQATGLELALLSVPCISPTHSRTVVATFIARGPENELLGSYSLFYNMLINRNVSEISKNQSLLTNSWAIDFSPFSLLNSPLRGWDGIQMPFSLSVNSFSVSREVGFTIL